MSEPFTDSKRLKCPKCGNEGTAARRQGTSLFRLVGHKFRIATRKGKQEIICVACGATVVPEESK